LLTNLRGTAGPDPFIRALAEDYDPKRRGWELNPDGAS
jgi:hypothetical protein